MKKIICLLLVFSLVLVTFSAPATFAFETGTNPSTNETNNGSNDRNANASISGDSTADKIGTAGKGIVNAILWFGYAIALGMVVIIGIKYILGSAEAKSNMKGAIVNWFIGAFIVFMCTTIVGWVLGIANIKDAGNGLANSIVDTVGPTSSSENVKK